jgi:uncharacterized protein YbjT (DUF2867 family)
MARILITGANGFIGRRLIYKLLNEGHEIFALMRIKGTSLGLPENPLLHVLYGDIGDYEKLPAFPRNLDAAYYLIHSMASVVENLIETEKEIAGNFVSAIEKTDCKQIVYLGGIIEDKDKLSPHLYSRLAVEEVLNGGRIPVTILRASIIIGSGSASFEIIRDLVEKLPVMIAPKWVRSYCQPISIQDILFYLTGVLLNPVSYGKTLDIGGPEAMTFKEVLLRYARFRDLTRYIIDVPVLTPKLSSYWLVLITSVKFSICSHLVESMKQNTRKMNTTIDEILPHQCLNYEESLELAFKKMEQNEIFSTWMDAWDLKKMNADIADYVQVPKEGCFKDVKVMPIEVSLAEVERRIWSIGGGQGWYSTKFAWEVRGLLDKLLGGTGLNRGRRDPNEIEVGDSIDFWRVLLANKDEGHLILYAEMKLPGEAWLEFKIDKAKNLLIQTATFRPKGVFGRLYWYAMFPFHLIIFRNMCKAIAQHKKV